MRSVVIVSVATTTRRLRAKWQSLHCTDENSMMLRQWLRRWCWRERGRVRNVALFHVLCCLCHVRFWYNFHFFRHPPFAAFYFSHSDYLRFCFKICYHHSLPSLRPLISYQKAMYLYCVCVRFIKLLLVIYATFVYGIITPAICALYASVRAYMFFLGISLNKKENTVGLFCWYWYCYCHTKFGTNLWNSRAHQLITRKWMAEHRVCVLTYTNANDSNVRSTKWENN